MHEQLLNENRSLQMRLQSHQEELHRLSTELRDRASAERSRIDLTHQKTLSELGARHEAAVRELGIANERLQAENRSLQQERLHTLEEASRLHAEDEKLRAARQAQISELEASRVRQQDEFDKERRRLDESHRLAMQEEKERFSREKEAAARLTRDREEELERERAKQRQAESRWHSEMVERAGGRILIRPNRRSFEGIRRVTMVRCKRAARARRTRVGGVCLR